MPYKALIIDDDGMVRRLTMRALTARGFDCMAAPNAGQARQLLSREPFDLVVADLLMPGENGYRLVCELLHRENRPAVVVLTGVIEPRLEAHLRHLGIDDVVFKPVEYHEFAARLLKMTTERKARTSSQTAADFSVKPVISACDSGKEPRADEQSAAGSDATENLKRTGNDAQGAENHSSRLENTSPSAVRHSPLVDAARADSGADCKPAEQMPSSLTPEPGGVSAHGNAVSQSEPAEVQATVIQATVTTTAEDTLPAELPATTALPSNHELCPEISSPGVAANAFFPTPSATLAQLMLRLATALQNARFDRARPFIVIKLSGGMGSLIALPVALLLVVCLAWQYSIVVQTRRTVDAIQQLGGVIDRTKSGEIVVRIGAAADGRSLDLLSRLPRIYGLDFEGTGLNDSQLERLAQLTGIRELNLSGTQITDRGLRVLRSFRDLESLSLDGTQVSAEGLKLTAGIQSLRHLSVRNTLATKETVEGIRRARPELHVHVD